MTTRRSARYPWARGGGSGLILLVTPFVWVVDVSSCGGQAPVQTELTGLVLLGRFDLGLTSWLTACWAVAVATPFLANRVQRAGAEVWVQVLGLVATGLFAYVGMFGMFFTIFSDRTPRLAGVVVLSVFGAMVLDAVTRVGLSVRQWWRVRASSAGP